LAEITYDNEENFTFVGGATAQVGPADAPPVLIGLVRFMPFQYPTIFANSWLAKKLAKDWVGQNLIWQEL
jgi:hypothetical protein